MPTLHYAPAAARTLHCLQRGRRADAAKLRRVRRALDQLASDPRHPGLRTHRYHALPGHIGRRVWDSYVETGADAWRIYWTWGPADHQDDVVVTVLLIGPHR
ncbi:type II toxin-antitoxin system RelE/ParE family toxin [Kitasatospora sp. NPDC051170]|uniref:type II toxin-antitoxin system RelE/ParE family toxin n=1 Tax=Kitasatospora sp. NPDC051170 TaxID=3364056 RepID=UPI0037ADDFA5